MVDDHLLDIFENLGMIIKAFFFRLLLTSPIVHQNTVHYNVEDHKDNHSSRTTFGNLYIFRCK